MKKILALFLALLLAASMIPTALAVNPYVPLWEHIPDGEPHVFGDRVYIFGSHDTFKTRMTGPDYVSWSAPVDDITAWRYEGVSFDGGESGYLLAPDVCQGLDGRYYMYTFGDCDQGGRGITIVAVADQPQGPYEYLGSVKKDGENMWIFDPAVIVDNGSVYIFGGSSNIWKLDPSDMCTIIEEVGQVQEVNDKGELVQIRNFFEASSIRRVGEWYVYIYASQYDLDTEHFSINLNNKNSYSGTLEYAYSKSIEGPYTYGGTLIDIGGENIYPSKGTITRAAYNGNTHGSIELVGDQWYVFYHRQTNGTQTFRQCCCEPLNLTYNDEGVFIEQAEVTSQGAEKNGLNPEKQYSAGIACYLRNYPIINTDVEKYDTLVPVVDIFNNAIVGYKYFNFEGKDYELSIDVKPLGVNGQIAAVLDDPANEPIALFELDGAAEDYVTLTQAVGQLEGKHALFFIFYAPSQAEICHFGFFGFTAK